MRALILFCVLLAMFVAVQAASPGIATAMSAPAMNQIVEKMLPGILAQIKSAPIDNMSGKESGFKYEVRDIQMRRLDVGAFTMAAQPDGLALSLKNLDVSIGLHWKYKKSGFPYVPFGSGTADVNLDDGNVSGKFFLSAVQTPEGLKPHLSVSNVACHIASIKIKVHGSIFSWLYNIILKAMQGKIRNTIQDSVVVGIRDGVAAASENIIKTLPLRAPVSKWGVIDYSLVSDTQHVDNAVIVNFNGEILDIDAPKSDGLTPRNGLKLVPDGSLFQMAMDVFVLNSAFHTSFHKHVFHRVLDKEHQGSIPLPLNTAAYKTLLPRLYALCPDCDMRVDLQFGEQPTVDAVPGALSARLPLAAGFSCLRDATWLEAFTVRMDAEGALDATIQPLNGGQGLFIALQNVGAKFSVVDSKVGDVDLEMLSATLNWLLNNIVLPSVNTDLLAGIPLPMPPSIALTNTKLQVVDKAVLFSTDIDFVPKAGEV